MSKSHKTRAPGKLIFSGEHAVVYGNPAIAMAIDKFATATLSWQLDADVISFDLPDTQLLSHALITTLEQLKLTLPHGLKIKVNSDIPISCGMGSSAAIIISFIYGLTTLLGENLDLETYFQLGRDIEHLPHGCSSGTDIYLALHGGCVRFENGAAVARTIPDIPLYMVNTGKPETTTKQCVAAVTKYFKSQILLKDFAAVTNDFDWALQKNNLKHIQACIRANHKLLTHIGVVPEPIQQFIAELEKAGAAAKICGAGTIAGETAGAVLVVSERDISAIVEKYNYPMFTLTGNPHGVQVI